MGQLVNLKCEKCGYETNLGLGAGMMFYDLDTVLSLFDKATQEKIREAVTQNGGKNWEAYKEIGVCDRCGKISAIAVFTITLAGGKELKYKAKCPCGAEVELRNKKEILEGREKIFCPACGDELQVTVTGHWD